MYRLSAALVWVIMVLASAHSSADGLSYSRQRMRAFVKRARAGERVFAVFDVDNTLVDTRYRTRAALTSLLRRPSTGAPLRAAGLRPIRAARLDMALIGYDGTETARRIGLGASETRILQRYWERFFWAPRNLRFDRPIKETIALAREAHALGLEVIYLTGRYADRRRASAQQLTRWGLPNVDHRHVIAKTPAKDTATFKAEVVRELEQQGSVALFLSDAHADVAAVQKQTKSGAAAVLVDFPVGPAGQPGAVDSSTPRISLR